MELFGFRLNLSEVRTARVPHCLTLFHIVPHCSTLFDIIVPHCSTLYCSTLFPGNIILTFHIQSYYCLRLTLSHINMSRWCNRLPLPSTWPTTSGLKVLMRSNHQLLPLVAQITSKTNTNVCILVVVLVDTYRFITSHEMPAPVSLLERIVCIVTT